MTQEDQDIDLAHAAALAAGDVKIDRCRHETVVETSIWVHRGGAQIGAVTRDGEMWRATRMSRGLPVGQRITRNLGEAMAYVQGA
jgi:hypothetical protein